MLIVLIDDVGFGATSAFGGPCQTPTADKLAAGGLKFNRFHTTALCSPTRQALLTGRNHHSVGMGGITEIATGAPGYNSVLPNTMSPLPEKLRDLQRLWLIEATRYNVLPLDDRLVERINPDVAGRPVLVEGKTQILFGGMGHLSENCVLSLKNKSHSITAEIVVPEKGAEGVIIAQGANIGGWSLYANGGKLKYCYNWGGFKHFMIEATTPIPAGEHQVRMEFAYAGGGLGKGGTVTLYTDGKKVGEGSVDATLANVFSADDGCDVGEDTGAPVSPDYGPHGNAFNGRVKGVQLAIAEAAEDLDHLIDPETAIRVAMARQ